MTRINEAFFKMAQSSAKTAIALTSKQGGAFDWDIAMDFLKMAYYCASVEEVEKFLSDLQAVLDDKRIG